MTPESTFPSFSEPLVERIGWTLLNFVWQGAVVVLVAETVARLMRRASSTARYGLLLAAFLVMSACPVITLIVLNSDSLGVRSPIADEDASRRFVAVETRADSESAGSETVDPSESATRFRDAPVQSARLDEVASVDGEATTGMRHAVAWWRRQASAGMPWIVSAWLAGVVVLSVRLLAGWRGTLRLHSSSASQPPQPIRVAFERIRRHLGINRPVALAQSSLVGMPSALGWLRPIVLLPVGLVSELSVAQWEAILAHELAHIRRHDYLVNLFQSFVEAILFYHPAVWRLSARLRAEREHCCDDVAVRAVGDRATFARALVRLAESGMKPAPLAVAAGDGDLLHRVRRLLNATGAQNRGASPWLGMALLATLGLMLVAACAQGRVPDSSDRSLLVSGADDASIAAAHETASAVASSIFVEPVADLPGGASEAPAGVSTIDDRASHDPPERSAEKGDPAAEEKPLTSDHVLRQVSDQLTKSGFLDRTKAGASDALPEGRLIALARAEFLRRQRVAVAKLALEVTDVRLIRSANDETEPRAPAFAWRLRAMRDLSRGDAEEILQATFPRWRFTTPDRAMVVALGFLVRRPDGSFEPRAADLKAGEEIVVWQNVGQEWHAVRTGTLLSPARAGGGEGRAPMSGKDIVDGVKSFVELGAGVSDRAATSKSEPN